MKHPHKRLRFLQFLDLPIYATLPDVTSHHICLVSMISSSITSSMQSNAIDSLSLYTSAIAKSLSAWNMAEGGSGSVDISLSMGMVRKRVQGNCFVTIGGVSIIKYPSLQKESPPDPSQNAASVEQKNYKTVVATTSEVVSKADLTSSTPWRVEFLPDKWYKRNTEKFSLVGVEFMEMHLSNEASSLMLFPTESLHKETLFPQFISRNDWASNRSQSCYQAQRKTKVKDTKIELICYVLVANDATGKFHVACYVLSVDEHGSYYLHPHGNKAKLKKLDDFQPTERPKGSVILNEDGYVVGFLAFSDTDEIHPLFLPDYLQGMLLLNHNLMTSFSWIFLQLIWSTRLRRKLFVDRLNEDK